MTRITNLKLITGVKISNLFGTRSYVAWIWESGTLFLNKKARHMKRLAFEIIAIKQPLSCFKKINNEIG